MKKCIIIPDSFKGTISSSELCSLSLECVNKIFPWCEVISIPVADGGEGTVDCFLQALNGQAVPVNVTGPYGEPITASYARFDDIAVIEMASVAGLPLVGEMKNPALTSTYGVGQMMLHAIDNGAKQIILGLGGSCTNDGGCGCAAALGVRYLDHSGNAFVPVGETLDKIRQIDISKAQSLLNGIKVIAMCDINNPMHGETGAAWVFGPQKGADIEMVRDLDRQLKHLDHQISTDLRLAVADIPGAGAAGAFGAGCVAFFGAELKSGIETVLDLVDFDTLLKDADMVFTGEGCIDGQSVRGKVISGVAKRAKAKGIPVIAIVGDISDDAYGAYEIGVTAIFSINRKAIPFSEAKNRSRQDYVHTMEDVLRCISAAETSSQRTIGGEHDKSN